MTLFVLTSNKIANANLVIQTPHQIDITRHATWHLRCKSLIQLGNNPIAELVEVSFSKITCIRTLRQSIYLNNKFVCEPFYLLARVSRKFSDCQQFRCVRLNFVPKWFLSRGIQTCFRLARLIRSTQRLRNIV